MKNFMKLACVVALAFFAAAQAHAVVYFSDTFTYSDGPITNVSGGVWNGFSGASPVNVSNGEAIVSQALTQDVAAQLTGSPHSNDVLYAKFDFNFSVVPGISNATSQFFFFKDSGVSSFMGRVFGVGTNGPGILRLGMNATAGGSPTHIFPMDLSTGTWYTAVLKVDQTAVASDKVTLWVNPTLESDPSVSATGTLANLAISTVALRQATTEGIVNIDKLVVGDSFGAVIPEPSTILLVGAGLVSLLAVRRRRS